MTAAYIGLQHQLQFWGWSILAAGLTLSIGWPLGWLAIKLGARLPQDSAKLSRFKSRLLVERRVIPFDETRRQAVRQALRTERIGR